MKFFRKGIAALLAICVLAGIVLEVIPENVAMAADQESVSKRAAEEEKLSTMTLLTENQYLELYIDEEDTNVAVRRKESGDIWFTSPIAADEDAIAVPINKRLLKSQFSLTYYNENVQANEMDNYNDSILNGQFEITPMENGVTVTYTLGEMESKLILPQAITKERYQYYFDQMDEDAQKQVKRNYSLLVYSEMDDADIDTYLETYPEVKNKDIYILKSGTKDYKKEELMEYFTALGYTAEEMQKDLADCGVVIESNKPFFIVPLSYILEGENLVVTVTPQDIEYNMDGYYLVDFDLLEYFGAGSMEDTGYLFVPDGSGALINFNNGKTSLRAYTNQVYGADATNNALLDTASEIDENLAIKLPVYGIKSGDQAMLAIIEDGEAYANINADIAGKTNSYNHVYAGFTCLQNGAISLGDIIGSNSFQMYASELYQGDYKIRFSFLSGEQADYSGMANAYREYLLEKGTLSLAQNKEHLPFYLELLGAIEKTKSFLGIKYDATVALTTYHQASLIIQELQNGGVDRIRINYLGWANKGLGNTAATRLRPVSELTKGGLSLEEFFDYSKEQSITTFMNIEMQRVYEDALFDGYTANGFAPRYFDRSIIALGTALIPNGVIVNRNINLISPFYLGEIISRQIKMGNKLLIPAISVGGLARDLYSDFQSDHFVGIQKAKEYNEAALISLSDNYRGNVLAKNSNVYAFSSVSDILEAPMDSNEFYILDETIPFYEMVISGCIEYAGAPMNLSDDYKESFLKSIETGSGIYFTWIYEDNSILKETDYDSYYSVNYKTWIKKAMTAYEEADELYQKVQGNRIVHHEKVGNGVYETIYANGTCVIVNYNKYQVTYQGIQIGAQDFAVQEGPSL